MTLLKPVIIISIVFVFLCIPIGIDNAHGYHKITSFHTDKQIYSEGEIIKISGTADWEYDDSLSLLITHDGQFVWIGSASLAMKSFSTEINSSGFKSGEYTIEASIVHGGSNDCDDDPNDEVDVICFDDLGTTEIVSKTSFMIKSDNIDSNNENIVEINGIFVEYNSFGGKIIKGIEDQSAKSIIFVGTFWNDGSLSLALPRNLIDAKLSGIDVNFVVLVDGIKVNFDESKNSEVRVLTIPIVTGNEEIEIIGTDIFELSNQLSSNSQNNLEKTPTNISVQGSNDMIEYEIVGGNLISVIPNEGSESLIVSIDSISKGTLKLVIPRTVLDATINEKDDEFIVLIDGEEIIFDEQQAPKGITYSGRTITISFPDGTEEIEIIGTFVIPEFGSIAMLILMISVISVVMVSRKFNKIRF